MDNREVETQESRTSGGPSIKGTCLLPLSAIATGTVVYVVFFEIFPKGKEVGGTGFQHVFAMAVGFAVFLPSLLFREF